MRVLALSLLAVALAAAPARAHQSSIKYVDITVDGDGAVIRFTVAPGDVTEPLGLRPDAAPTVDAAAVPAAAAYVARWLAVSAGGTECPRSAATAQPDPDRRFVAVAWTAGCGTDRLRYDFAAFFAVDPRHEAIVTIHRPGEQREPIVVRATRPVIEPAPSLGEVLFATGGAPLWFVIGLVVAAVLARDGAGWRVRTPRETVRAAAVVVAGFLVAQAAALLATALGAVALPSHLVAILAAGSVAYLAVENVVRPDAPWRLGMVLAFGVVHGLGLRPPTGYLVGAAAAQLAIAAVALVVAWSVARLIGPVRYRRHALAIVGAPMVVLAVLAVM